MDYDRASYLLEPASDDAGLMMRLRGLLVDEMNVTRMTDHAVVEEIAHEVARGRMELEVKEFRRAKAKVTFADLLKNYPKNEPYQTTTDSEPNIWKLVGGKVYYNATHDDPTTGSKIFVNSCATRMSRALNYSGAPIEHTPSTVSGADGKWYLFRVSDLDPLMRKLFGTPKTLTLYAKAWRREIKGKTGVLKFTASWRNASGHFTLWNGAQMVNGRYDDDDANDPAVNGVVFWEVQ